jgi:hypothetical protein
LLPAERALREQLRRVRARWFRLVALTVASRTLLGTAVALFTAAAIDRWLHPAGGWVLVLCGACLLSAGLAMVVGGWRYRRYPDDLRVARFVEEQCPEFDGEVVAAADAAAHAGDTVFSPMLVRRAASRLAALDGNRVIARDVMRSAAARTALAAVALAVAGVAAVPVLARAALEARVRFWPSSLRIDVLPGDVRVRAGMPLIITARIEAGGRLLTSVMPEVELEAGGQRRVVRMMREGNGFDLRVNAVDRAFTYRVRAGHAVSTRYSVAALFAPRVEAIDLRYEYPRFSALAPRDETDGGDIYAPAGTRVRLRVRADKPVAAAAVTLGAAADTPVRRLDERTFESFLTLTRDGSYRASVTDADGLRGESVEYFIRLAGDRPAEIHIVRPAGDQQITPLEEVTIQAKADDDYGVASMDMVFAVAGGPERVVRFQTLSGAATSRVGSRMIAAEELGVKPGDVISYYARATDVPHAKASTLSRSEIYFLEVKPFDAEFSAADSQAMAASTGTELDGLIAAQKEVISATWNLQRRAGTGTSIDDVRAVANAQAEVKTRTERAAAMSRPRRGIRGMFFQFAAQLPDGAGPGNVADAAVAMGRALEHLKTGSTKEAMSPEMAALNALLKAEAEIRQRHLAQQNGASTFGNGRQGQDLSNLFDRELKRQQRTNYESGSQAEHQPAHEQTSAVDRINDLARRQEDLARRQRALDGLRDEERARELERLKREQEEVRRELEQATRDQRTDGASGSSGRSDASAQAAMREALDGMRRAGDELQRSDAGRAATRASDAARQLRNAEAQLRGSGQPASDDQSRKLADTLDALRAARDRLAQLERRLADLERAQRGGQQPVGNEGREERGTPDGPRAGSAQGNRTADELDHVREQYAQEVERARDLMGHLDRPGRAAATPEQHEWSWGAPGTEAWKQDFAKWEVLGKDAGRALERYESSVGNQLAKSLARDRLTAGASERVPDMYADRVARYYESLARAASPATGGAKRQ